MGTLPYEHDRVMGVASVGSQESVRFGEENDPETEEVQDTVAHNQEDLDQTREEEDTYHDANPGIGEFHGGFGSASLRESLGRVAQSSTTPSATCHSGEGVGENATHMSNPSQVMSPKTEQNPSQDSTSAHGPPAEDTSYPSQNRERKEDDPTPKYEHEQEQFDVKEEPGEDFPPIGSSDPMCITYCQDTSAGPSEAPWNWGPRL